MSRHKNWNQELSEIEKALNSSDGIISSLEIINRFEAIDEEELKKKLEETLEGMQNLFDASCSSLDETNSSFNNINMENTIINNRLL